MRILYLAASTPLSDMFIIEAISLEDIAIQKKEQNLKSESVREG